MSPVAPHTPIQYIIGKADFCGIDFSVDERVLIPRPETELLVEKVIDLAGRSEFGARSWESGARELKILDLCTGSGNIAISLIVRLNSPSTLSHAEGLTKSITNCRIVASDISEDAIAVARSNAVRKCVADRIDFVKSDLFTDVEGSFDMIVSNPPYIARPEFETLHEEVLREPRIALDGGDDGLQFYRNILSKSHLHLKPNGHIVFEIGCGQLNAIRDIIRDTGHFELTDVEKDWRGIDRVIVVNPHTEIPGGGSLGLKPEGAPHG